VTIQTHLEELVDKDARERSDAASEAFLAELALDAKRNANKVSDTKQSHDKSKDKKKVKDSRKSKDLKVSVLLNLIICVLLLLTNGYFIFFLNYI
jgi:hypothetical protein